MTPSSRPNYTVREVDGLVSRYGELIYKQGVHSPGSLDVLVRLADLRIAVPHLSAKQREAILLVGIAGHTELLVSEMLDISQQAVHERYRHAVERLTELMNQGGR